jgi:hypothetical protein
MCGRIRLDVLGARLPATEWDLRFAAQARAKPQLQIGLVCRLALRMKERAFAIEPSIMALCRLPSALAVQKR